jgi:hypothetical protein
VLIYILRDGFQGRRPLFSTKGFRPRRIRLSTMPDRNRIKKATLRHKKTTPP